MAYLFELLTIMVLDFDQPYSRETFRYEGGVFGGAFRAILVVGRDVSGAETSMSSGLLAEKQGTKIMRRMI